MEKKQSRQARRCSRGHITHKHSFISLSPLLSFSLSIPLFLSSFTAHDGTARSLGSPPMSRSCIALIEFALFTNCLGFFFFFFFFPLMLRCHHSRTFAHGLTVADGLCRCFGYNHCAELKFCRAITSQRQPTITAYSSVLYSLKIFA